MTLRDVTELRTCLHQYGGSCTRTDPCLPCVRARSRALKKAGPDFPALGFLAVQGFLDNA